MSIEDKVLERMTKYFIEKYGITIPDYEKGRAERFRNNPHIMKAIELTKEVIREDLLQKLEKKSNKTIMEFWKEVDGITRNIP